MIRFYLLRHADKAIGDYFNPRVKLNDQPISEFGFQQAAKLVGYFDGTVIQAIYVSEYTRTEQTVRPLARKLKITPVVEKRLNEIDIGLAEKLTDDELREQYPQVWQAAQEWNRDFRWPEGERGAEAQARIVNFIQEQLDQEGNILVVAHDGIIRLLVCYVLGLPVYRRAGFQLDTACVTEIDWDKTREKWKLIRFNQSTG